MALLSDLFQKSAGQWHQHNNLKVYWHPQYLHNIVRLNEQTFYDRLVNELAWQQGEVTVYGKKHLEPRLSAYYGDANSHYRYSGKTVTPLAWQPLLLDIKHALEATLNTTFNAVLCNYYRNGGDGMGWHSDNEPELGPSPTIASVSLGNPRKFNLRHKKDKSQKMAFNLGNGDLLVMAGKTQHYWEHNITKTTRAIGGRINLTYRLVNADFNSLKNKK